jgi:two-component system alkaline phosphatase synthesis response regulator PhoP
MSLRKQAFFLNKERQNMIYILEDDASIKTMLSYAIQKEDETKGFEKPSLFWKALKEEACDLIILDLMLPEEDGLTILKKLKQDPNWEDIPVLILSAKDSEVDKAIGLDHGADDYLAKPFGIMELLSRIKAIKRRYEKTKKKQSFKQIGPVVFDAEKHQVKVDNDPIELSYKEFNLLRVLIEAQGAVVKREDLLEQVWGPYYEESRTLDVHIRKLRKKLGNAGTLIKTVKNVGYQMSDE